MLFSESLYIYILVCGDDMVWNSGIINDSNNLMLSVGILINVVHVSHMFARFTIYIDAIYIYMLYIYIYVYTVYI